ncbi:hypothetical protein NFI96_020183 [Prochilodus magdalenae]|nr:hypothetical protein NFI96_020183 [Prochilodus magdalenae]
MSWFADLAGRAEDFLNKVDQGAATALTKQSTRKSSLTSYAPAEPVGSSPESSAPYTAPYEPHHGYTASSSSQETPGFISAAAGNIKKSKATVLAGTANVTSMTPLGSAPSSSGNGAGRASSGFVRPKKQEVDDDLLFDFLNSSDPPQSEKREVRRDGASRAMGVAEGLTQGQGISGSVAAAPQRVPSAPGTPPSTRGLSRNSSLSSLSASTHSAKTEDGSTRDFSQGDSPESSDSGLAAPLDPPATVDTAAPEEQVGQVMSSLRLENQLLRSEVSSLNQELASFVQRAKDTQEELNQTRARADKRSADQSRTDRTVRELRAQVDDFTEALSAKDAQLAILKVRLDEADQLLKARSCALEEAQNERSRILQDHSEGNSLHSQALQTLQDRLREAEVALKREQDGYRQMQSEFAVRLAKMEAERQTLAESLTSTERRVAEEKQRMEELQQQAKSARTAADYAKQELQDYKNKASRILQSKEKLISSLKESSGLEVLDGGGAAAGVELEELRHEKELQREEIQKLQAQTQTLRSEIQELESQAMVEAESWREQQQELQEQNMQLARAKQEVEAELERCKQELQYVEEEQHRTKSTLQSRIKDREDEIQKLRNQLTNKALSSTSQAELEGRLHQLTETLIQKQTMLEALGTEKSSLIFQLERLEQQLKSVQGGQSSGPHINMAAVEGAGARQRNTPVLFGDQDSSATGVYGKVRKAASTIDRFSIRLGIFLRRYPAARVFVIVYMNGSGSSSVTSPALVLVETPNESVCGGTVVSTKMNGTAAPLGYDRTVDVHTGDAPTWIVSWRQIEESKLMPLPGGPSSEFAMSWLGGLGSGLGQSLGQVGGSLSSFTGQISNFTKDILLEGTEEVGDAATELQVSNSKLVELETSFATQRSEYDRLRRINAELEEKLEAAEIQVKQQSLEYRTLLQQKEVEISHLKARHNTLQEEVQKFRSSPQSIAPSTCDPAVLPVTTGVTTTSSSSYLSRTSSAHHGFHGDEVDLSDVLWSQQEINRLSSEVHRLEADVAHWRRVAQASKAPGAENGDQGECLKLQRTIKELREAMGREVDEHQHELAALQDAHRQKLSDITKRHREELAEYEERIEELEEQIQSGGGATVAAPSAPQDSSRLQELQATVHSLREELGLQKAKHDELMAGLEEAGRLRTALEREKEEAKVENAELLQNYSRLQSSVSELQTRVQEQEGKAMFKAQQDGEIQALRKALAAAEQEVSRLKSSDTESKAEVEHADILELNTIIGTLRQEKEDVEREKAELAEKLKLAEEREAVARTGDSGDLQQEVSDLKTQLDQREQALKQAHLDMDTLTAELEELDRQNQEATQHLITLKDQLAGQKSQAEAEVTSLRSELSDSHTQKEAMLQELEAQKQKLSQSAFTLNELHMGKQQLESTVKELREKLSKSQELGKEARLEASDLKKLLQEKESQLSAVREELSHAGEHGTEAESQRTLLEEKDGEIQELRKEVAELKVSYEKRSSEDFDLKIENRKLKEESVQALEKVKNLDQQLRDGQASLSRVVLEKDTRIEALKLEKSQLEGELNQLEKRLSEQAKQYQGTIEELTRARSLDASALQMEHERAVKLNQEKDLTIAELRREMEQMASDHKDTSEMLDITVAGQKQLTELLQEKDAFAASLKAQAADAQKELETSVSQAKLENDALRKSVEEKDKQLGAMKEENSHLKEEIDRLRDQQSRPQPMSEPRTLDIITELETEVAQLKAARDKLQEEAGTLRKASEEQRESLLQSQHSLQVQQSELEQARSRHEQSTLNYEKRITAKDEEISRLESEVESLSVQRQSQPQTVDILQEDKTRSLGGENGNEKHDLSKVEIERLVKGIKEKETEIIQLNEKNLSLTKQLDQLVVSRDEVGKLSQMVLQKDREIQALHARVSSGGYGQDFLLLQQQIQAYAVEREQVLAVLNEKTRENSQLRSEYHRIMDIVAAKEAALLKLQQENQRLSTMSDPSGSQEMFRETIQNLSRIIREKDIEIDALTQKCQTLVTVLQSSSGESGNGGQGGVSSNQFEELLQERDILKQQVKKMDEWKQQVITTVKNMQHESAQLHEELLKLQGQVSADSDCSSKLSVDYARLIQSYEQKERRLGSLSQELAQVQQTISQLSSTKDVLLGKLDSFAQAPDASVPSVQVAERSQVSVAPPSVHPPVRGESLQENLEALQRALAEKESTIRTLQENNHRLSNSASLSESEQRGHAEELRQARERIDTLQRSLREKDLLIKSKGDQLTQVSENLRNRENDNEVLKQAVTNLKERALIFELDVKKLKEENEAVAVKSREKETEFRALQETNMQVSLLLREREFEWKAVSEKAAAMEKLLKDREQGKSGELNQLLNEVRSMQEKAIAFQQERDQVMLALKQKQMETSALQSELQHTKDKEQRQKVELERLRNHLLEIEDSYTREALAAEDRESDLRRRVAQLDEKLASSCSAVESASQQASLQVESLQEQLNVVVRQRDEALIQLHAAQEQTNQYAVSLSNLQMVLEQFQQEEKAMYSAELEKHKREKDEWRRKAETLEDRASSLQLNLDEANAALESASRLTDQLDLKEEQIEELKKQGEARQEMLDEAQQKLTNLLNSTEGKVDKVLMKNLFLGYFHTPRNKRCEVLRLMGNVLGLERDEVEKLLEDEGRRGVTGWVSGWLGSSRAVQSVPNTPQRPTQNLNGSFSEMFLKFLEVESSPAAPAPKLPVYDIKPLSAPPPGRSTAGTTTAGAAGPSKRGGDSNPFLAPRSAAIPLLTPGVPGGGGPASGHLLMKPISDALPTFTPMPVSAEASAGAVLKDLLKQ